MRPDHELADKDPDLIANALPHLEPDTRYVLVGVIVLAPSVDFAVVKTTLSPAHPRPLLPPLSFPSLSLLSAPTCGQGYSGSGCTPNKCTAVGSGSGTHFDPPAVVHPGEVTCDTTTGDFGGLTGSCTCTCHAGYEGDSCNLAKVCVAGDGVLPGTIKCSHRGGKVEGNTGECACDCIGSFHGQECELRGGKKASM